MTRIACFACLAIALLAGGCGGAKRGPDPADGKGPLSGMNVLLVTLDTTRADHVSAYGATGREVPAGLTPVIDGVAAEGILFENALSQTNSTNSSHVAIFSGQYALDSGILNNETTFPGSVDILPQAFRRAGYKTAGFPAIAHVSETLLKLPGFDFTYPIPRSIDAEEVTDRFLGWLAENGDAPFFAWVHYYDPHTPYYAPPPYPQRFYKGDPTSGTAPRLIDDPYFRLAPVISKEQFGGVRDREYPKAMYRAEMRYTDTELGRLLERLDELGISDRTAVVLVADHGETLGEHRIYYSHFSLHETNLSIPLIFRLPGFDGARTVAQPVTHLDLAPTLCELFDVSLETPDGLPGKSLVPLLRGEPSTEIDARDLIIQEHSYNQQVSVREGPWKYVRRIVKTGYDLPEDMLFNLERDPRELRNLASREKDRTEAMRAHVKRWIDTGAWTVSNVPPGEDATDEERARFEEQMRQLERLGYVNPGAAPTGEDSEGESK